MTTPHQPINAVADFGADPTGQADSAAAIQAAMNAAGALGAGGGAVYLPPGTYSTASASLVPVTGVRLFGDPVNDGNVFDNIAFENPLGGAIWLESCRGSEIANCLAWDVAGVIANSLFKASKNASGGASTSNTFRSSGHVNGSFAAGASDIQLDAACTGTLILHPRPAAASIDLGGAAGTDILGVTSAVTIRNPGASLGAKYLGGPTVAYPAGVQADNTRATVTGTAFASLTRAWPLAAQEETTGTVYKLTASGRGAWGPVPAQLNFRWLLLGAAGAVSIAAAAFPAGQAFSWALTALVRVTATGAAGTCDTVVQGCLSASGGAFTAASSVPVVVTSTKAALDSTAAHTFALQARWLAGGTGGTITCDGSVFERAGA